MAGEQPPQDNEEYAYNFDFGQHEQEDVYKGSSKVILPCTGRQASNVMWRNEEKNMSIICFESEEEKRRYCNWAKDIGQSAYIPNFKALGNGVHGVHGVGRSVGTPLLVWLARNAVKKWEYDQQGKIFRLSSDLRALGRWVGGELTIIHSDGKYVGDILRSTYVDQQAKRVSFCRRDSGHYHNLSPEVGIQKDLENLKMLVDLISSMLPQNSVCPEIDMFNDLYQQYGALPNDIEKLKSISYVLCHAPLYWDTEQRQAFCYTYWSLRQHDMTGFDSHMKNFRKIDNNWYLVQNLRHSFCDVYAHLRYNRFQNNTGVTEMKHLLIPFHRQCLQHSTDYEPYPITLTCAQIDQKLLEVFPHAISDAYNVFVHSTFTRDPATAIRDGIPGLDLSKSIKRRRGL